MKRTATVLGATILAVGLSVLGPSSAVADDLDSTEFTVKAVTVSEHYEDAGRKGESIGDYIVFQEKLFHAGERVGSAAVVCHLTRARRTVFRLLCWATVTLRGRGDIIVQGKVAFREGSTMPPVLAVTGGTGDYVGASGTMTVDESRRHARYHFVLTP
jgi:hypothetical protein